MQVGMYYWKTCVSGRHVFHENMWYGRTCVVGGHVMQVCVTTLEQGCGQTGHSQGYFRLPEYHICQFQGDPYSHFAVYCIHLILIKLVVFTYLFIYVYNKLENGCEDPVENWQM